MKRALVIVEDSDRHRELLREAGELAAGVGAELVLLSVLTEDEFESDLKTYETIANVENVGFGQETIIDTAESFARSLATEVFEGLDVEYEAVGKIVDDDGHADAIIRTAENRDCDHVFVTGRRRSPAGKAIFGDVAQAIILNYDGPVTVLTG